MNPEDLQYTQSHEWVRIDRTSPDRNHDYAQKELVRSCNLELPESVTCSTPTKSLEPWSP